MGKKGEQKSCGKGGSRCWTIYVRVAGLYPLRRTKGIAHGSPEQTPRTQACTSEELIDGVHAPPRALKYLPNYPSLRLVTTTGSLHFGTSPELCFPAATLLAAFFRL